jgi:hypothetical protein
MNFTLQRRMLVLVLGVTLAVVVAVVLPEVASAGSPVSGEHPNNGEPPDTVDLSVITVGSCPFPVRIDISGKANTVELPGERTIVTSPGARATLTNLNKPANQVSYLITGAYHKMDRAGDDSVEVVTTGRALLFDRSFGMLLAIGRFTFGFDEEEGSYVTKPTGAGRMIDVCVRLR